MPLRKEIRERVIGNIKVPSPAIQKPQSVKAPLVMKPSAPAYRVSGKAGTQMKADHFFKKVDSQMTPAEHTPVVSTPKEPAPVKSVTQPSIAATMMTSDLGKKRKREEMEKKFDENLTFDNTKRSKQIESSTDKAKFDSNLYSLEESSEEPKLSDKPPSPKSNKRTVQQNFNKGSKIINEEEEEIENVSPNTKETVAVGIKKRPTVVRKKVIKTRTYKDEDGFDVTENYEEYEEVEVNQDMDVDVKPAAKTLDSKKASFKQPPKGQSSLSSFFNRS